MALELTLTFSALGELAHFLEQSLHQGAVLVPLPAPPADLAQYATIQLHLLCGDEHHEVSAETLQLMPPAGIVVRIDQPEETAALVGDTPATAGSPPEVAIGAPELTTRPVGPKVPPGMSPISWPIEKLQAEFSTLSTADKVRLAKYGKRPARALVLRSQDRTLLNFLLMNNKIGPDEVAIIAGMANADNALLQRIATSREWLRHVNIVRNLVCNPKMTIPQVTKLINHLPVDELRRLTRSGRVRAAVKRAMIKKIERGR